MRNKAFAIGMGVLCHGCFLLGISAMAYMMFFGLSQSLLPIGGDMGRVFNIILLLQFPIVHSALLSNRGRKFLSTLAPREIGKDLVTTTFALVASLQLLLVFGLWTPTRAIWFSPTGNLLFISSLLYASSWILLIKALYDAGLSLHSGFLGWRAIVQGEHPKYNSFPKEGLFSICRQPIYLSFALILLTAPVWTFDRLAITLIWGLYCFVGPRLKEKRFLVFYGDRFAEYQEAVPYMIPVKEWRYRKRS